MQRMPGELDELEEPLLAHSVWVRHRRDAKPLTASFAHP